MTLAGAALALFAGAALQSATGFGFALVSAPILFALLGAREAVTAGVLVAMLLNLLTLAGERRRPQVRAGDAAALLAWSLPGLAVGAVALRALSERLLSGLVAVAVFAGLALRVLGRRRAATARPRAWHLPAAGLAGGALSTSTSLNGPPLVFCLLARGASPVQMRDTLAAIFVVQAALGVPALLLSGTFAMPDAVWLLLLAGVAGQFLGRRAFGRLQGERYERVVLVVLALTALVALASSLL
ncbi:MAG: uncharacterized protein QOD69_737 [Solirubrobacteraceae bacterium]|nr:uncharacterized protein [Solirubrobacteraceae bacterium]